MSMRSRASEPPRISSVERSWSQRTATRSSSMRTALADRERKIPNGLQTRFRIGSMNKMFTAVAILQLVEAGRIELTAPVGRYLFDYPNREIATKVTIHQLLTHTGGTGDILGATFEAPSYDPAGITSTGSLPEDVDVPNRSIGYMKRPGATAWAANTNTLPYRGTSAGGGYSTVDDFARFADALMSNVLLSPDSTELLITAKTDVDPDADYAYGFADNRGADGTGFVGHGGGAPGMNGDLRIYSEVGLRGGGAGEP